MSKTELKRIVGLQDKAKRLQSQFETERARFLQGIADGTSSSGDPNLNACLQRFGIDERAFSLFERFKLLQELVAGRAEEHALLTDFVGSRNRHLIAVGTLTGEDPLFEPGYFAVRIPSHDSKGETFTRDGELFLPNAGFLWDLRKPMYYGGLNLIVGKDAIAEYVNALPQAEISVVQRQIERFNNSSPKPLTFA